MIYNSEPSPINLSFSGCGFLGIYHVGVIAAFKEHASEVLEGKMAGCSAGSLAAACAMSGCCIGQMCSDVLEIAIRARSRALGPLHPTFNIVDIVRNGLRRILPPNAHEICSGRLFISLTRWKDNKNVVINQFHTREELIQVLICSSFVPYWSGIIPPKFREEVRKIIFNKKQNSFVFFFASIIGMVV
jgi:patatin-like phospholipase domain-containing protein 2